MDIDDSGQREQLTPAAKAAMTFCIVIYLAAVVVLSISVEESFFFVILGTLPTALYMIIVFSSSYEPSRQRYLVWLLPLLLIIIFSFLTAFNIRFLKSMDAPALIALNFVLSYLFAAAIVVMEHKKRENKPEKRVSAKENIQKYKLLLSHLEHIRHTLSEEEYAKRKQAYESELTGYKRKVHDLQEEKKELKRQLAVNKENFVENIKSLEDKLKAINFVIGRVYSNKKGGSAKQRSMIKFERQWYNQFSKISANYGNEQKKELLVVLRNIHNRLKKLELQENKVFELAENPMIEIKRNKDGSEVILDVLEKNDEDPIRTYYKSALDVSKALLDFLE